MAKGYAVIADVAKAYGQELTIDQAVYVDQRLGAVEETIDAALGRAWLTGPIVAQRYVPAGTRLPLRSRPVASVQSVTGSRCGAAATTLVVDVDYRIEDLTAGTLWLRAPRAYDVLWVSYTPVATVPERVRWATAEMLATALRGAASAATADIKRQQVFGQIDVTYRDAEKNGEPMGLLVHVWEQIAPLRYGRGTFA